MRNREASPAAASPTPHGEGRRAGKLNSTLPVVCIGMSAGGLEALKPIMESLSPTSGMAYVVVSHMGAGHETYLPELLAGWSEMPAELVKRGLVIRPNHVYVLPPGQEIRVCDGYFSIQAKSKTRGYSNVVTLFLESLTSHRKPPGIAVILSGIDADGVGALEAFSRAGGFVIVQDPRSAQFKDMPRSAIGTGMVNYVLSPEEIPARLADLGKRLTSGGSADTAA